MVTLREITKDNWEDVYELKIEESQKKFVAANSYSILEAHYGEDMYPRAIYSDEKLVGFLMYDYDKEDKTWGMCRLMIDKEHQKKGYGREAIGLLINIIKNEKNAKELLTSFEPENTVARKLYESIGFVATGEIYCGEVVEKLVF